MVITFNYKDGSETVSLSEIENSDLSSDLTASALPKTRTPRCGVLVFLSGPAIFSSRTRRNVPSAHFTWACVDTTYDACFYTHAHVS